MGSNAEFNRMLQDNAAKRRDKMLKMREQGRSVHDIMAKFGGISRQRVYAILAGAKPK